MREIVLLAAFWLGAVFGVQNRCVAQNVGASLSANQAQAVVAAIQAAQAGINLMPPGPERDAAQQGLNNFKAMAAKGRVGVRPRPGGTGSPLGAWTGAEYKIPGGGGGGGGGGQSGGTPEVGGGGEYIDLGGLPDGSAGGSLVGTPNGNGPTTDPSVAGGPLIQEGIRSGQSWERAADGSFRDPSDCFEYWNNEVFAYSIQVAYYNALVGDAEQRQHAGDVAFFSRQLERRQARLFEAEMKRSECGN